MIAWLREQISSEAASSAHRFFATNLGGNESTDVWNVSDVTLRGVIGRLGFSETPQRSAGDPTCEDFAPARPAPGIVHIPTRCGPGNVPNRCPLATLRSPIPLPDDFVGLLERSHLPSTLAGPLASYPAWANRRLRQSRRVVPGSLASGTRGRRTLAECGLSNALARCASARRPRPCRLVRAVAGGDA